MSVCVSVCLCLCVDRAKAVSRRAVTGWSVARLPSSSRHRQRRHLSPASVAVGDIIDDGDAEMNDDSSSYFSLPLDVKPPSWLLTSVCYY